MLDARGRLVGIEVKATASVSSADFRGLRVMEEATGRRFHRGVLLYLGDTAVAVGPNMCVMPLPALWRMTGWERRSEISGLAVVKT